MIGTTWSARTARAMSISATFGARVDGGGGLEFPLTANWIAQLEAGFYRFAGKGIHFPTAMTNFNSNLSLFTAHAGLVYQFGAETKPESERKQEDSSLVEAWSIHGQSTLIGMNSLPFHADYSGAYSLFNGASCETL